MVFGFCSAIQSCQPLKGWQDYPQNQIHNRASFIYWFTIHLKKCAFRHKMFIVKTNTPYLRCAFKLGIIFFYKHFVPKGTNEKE